MVAVAAERAGAVAGGGHEHAVVPRDHRVEFTLGAELAERGREHAQRDGTGRLAAEPGLPPVRR